MCVYCEPWEALLSPLSVPSYKGGGIHPVAPVHCILITEIFYSILLLDNNNNSRIIAGVFTVFSVGAA